MPSILSVLQSFNIITTLMILFFSSIVLFRLIKERALIKRASLRELNYLLMIVFFTFSLSGLLQSFLRIWYISGIFRLPSIIMTDINSLFSLIVNVVYLYTIIQIYRYQTRK